MKSATVAILSILLSLGLVVTGASVTISNLVSPSGHLFEGVVLFSLGAIILVLLSIASTLGKVIQTFNDIYTQQVEIQKTVNDFYSNQKPKTLGEILGGLGTTGGFTITDLTTGQTTSNPDSDQVTNIFDMIQKIRESRRSEESLDKLSIQQLEEKLAQAVKNDDFELAKEIRDLIKNKSEEK
jgi:hypothetical protein